MQLPLFLKGQLGLRTTPSQEWVLEGGLGMGKKGKYGGMKYGRSGRVYGTNLRKREEGNHHAVPIILQPDRRPMTTTWPFLTSLKYNINKVVQRLESIPT